ncbi:hypothetical protein [Dyadobacter sp. LHD-138]|uniref:hypothetical protein n=1 Tax=Dyadobacter sp. LHD-138 TaxID=3071413 RepID=UPI0027E0EB4B|nr:hypothetical protein [Dyadobacter sp. LHD-138]MDQ6482639.1 hypothetical protein [Dyadobacter sp. LHD-138]
MKNKSCILATLTLFISVGCCGLKAQETRTVDGEYKGTHSTYYYTRAKNSNMITIWNMENKLFKEPMIYPKGKMVGPNYMLIDAQANIGNDPFAKRFPPFTLHAATVAARKVINEINKDAITQEKLEKFRAQEKSFVITYYFSPDGIIRELEFHKNIDDDIAINELEVLEREIKKRLRYVTENSDYKGGNYIKASSGWTIVLP